MMTSNTIPFNLCDLEQIKRNQLPVLTLIQSASHTLDFVTVNGDSILGVPANILLAAARSHIKVRYIRSMEGASEINRTIEKIIYRLHGESKMRYGDSNFDKSYVIVDGNIGLVARNSPNGGLNYEYINSIDALGSLTEEFALTWSNAGNGKIRCVLEAIKLISGLAPPRSKFLLRGQSNHEWLAKPKLFRDPSCNLHEVEEKYIKPILLRSHYEYTYSYDPIEVFVNRQHYGDSTRLLDFTHDILIALFFACYDNTSHTEQHDGKIYILLREYFDNMEHNNVFDQPPVQDKLDELNKALEDRILNPKVLVVDPLIRNPRMRSQDGVFLLFPRFKLNDEYLSVESFIRESNKQNGNMDAWYAHKLVDKDFKQHILRELHEVHGISENTLFHKQRS